MRTRKSSKIGEWQSTDCSVEMKISMLLQDISIECERKSTRRMQVCRELKDTHWIADLWISRFTSEIFQKLFLKYSEHAIEKWNNTQIKTQTRQIFSFFSRFLSLKRQLHTQKALALQRNISTANSKSMDCAWIHLIELTFPRCEFAMCRDVNFMCNGLDSAYSHIILFQFEISAFYLLYTFSAQCVSACVPRTFTRDACVCEVECLVIKFYINGMRLQ